MMQTFYSYFNERGAKSADLTPLFVTPHSDSVCDMTQPMTAFCYAIRQKDIFSFSLIIFYFQVTSKTSSTATNHQPQLEQTRSQPYRTAPLVTPSPITVNEGGGFYQQFRGPQYNPTPRQQHRVNMTNNLGK